MSANLIRWRGTRSRAEIAALAGITEKYLEMLEKGERSLPSSMTAIKIAGAFGRSVNDLYSDEPTEPDATKVPIFVWQWTLSADERAPMAEDMARASQEIKRIHERLQARLREVRRDALAQRIKRR